MRSVEVEIRNSSGLHARPAAVFVRAASHYKAAVTLQNVDAGRPAANAKSLIAVLGCGVERGHRIRIDVDGPDEDEAVRQLSELVVGGLGEA